MDGIAGFGAAIFHRLKRCGIDKKDRQEGLRRRIFQRM